MTNACFLSPPVPPLAQLPHLNLPGLPTLSPLPAMLPSQLPPLLSQGVNPLLPNSTNALPASVTPMPATDPVPAFIAPTEAASTNATEALAPTETTLISS